MTVAEIKDQTIEFGTQQIANLQEAFKEVDWKGLPVKALNFTKEQGTKAIENAKTEPMLTTFNKVYNLVEMIPGLGGYAGMGRGAYALAKVSKDTMASWTVRPFTLGISGTFKKYWTEDVVDFAKHMTRAAVVVLGAENYIITGAAVAAYDLATNNIESLKESKYVPNFWA